MKWFDNTALTLVIIGALNWLLVGIFKLGYRSRNLWKSYMDFQNYLYHYRFYVDFISSAFMEESEVHPKKGIRIIGCPSIFLQYYFSGIASTIAVISYK